MQYYNFDGFRESGKAYGGSERKKGIVINGSYYMLKFQKKTPFGFRYNTISEYIGSHVYHLLGIDSQDTYLGTFHGEEVVACKDFVDKGFQFVPFNDIGESTIDEDKERYQYSYEDITELLTLNKKLTNVEETISSFFDIYIVDALLGNFDRHGGNWGFLKKNNTYTLAPVFDNGSCLYPNMINEDEMKYVISDEKEINRRIFKFPTSQILLDGKKSSYYEVISSLKYDEINKALERVYPRINIQEINILIEEIPSISTLHKQFYKLMIKERYEKIIVSSISRLKEMVKHEQLQI